MSQTRVDTAQVSGLAASATTDTTNATNITSGTLGGARLPAPGAATLGGVQSINCSAGGQFVQAINTNGTETCATPSAGVGNVSGPGTVTNGYLPLWGASNNLLTAGLAVSTVSAASTVPEAGVGGTLAPGWLPSAGSHTVNTTAPLSGGGAVSLGGTLTLSCPTCLTANAVPSVFGRTGAVTAQSGDYSAAQISGLAASATTDTTNAANIASGTLGAARLPTPGAATLGGVLSITCLTGGQFVQAINTNGTETCGTPAGGGNVSGPGTVTNGFLPLWGASNNLLTAGLAVSTTAAANTVAEAGAGGTLATGWLPSPSSMLTFLQTQFANAFAQKFFSSGAPEAVAGNEPGDLDFDYTNSVLYRCLKPPGTTAPACTAAGAGNWVADGTGGGGNVSGPGTVTNGFLPLWGASNNLLTVGLAVSTVSAANTVPEAGVGGTLAPGWLPSAGSHTVNTTAPLSGGGAVSLGGTLTLSCPTCLTANAVPSVFGRTGAVTAQSGDYSAAQITGLAASATTDATNAANIASGTLGAARLPTPAATTLGGVQSKDCTSGGQFLQKINTDGTETCGTPAGGGNVSGPGTVTNGYLPLWGASNNLLTVGLAVSTVSAANTVPEAGVGGTLAAGWLPSAGSHTVNTTAPLSGGGAVSLGGTLTLSCPTCLTANAVPSVFGRTGAVTAQSGDYSAAQITGLAASATTDTTNAANIASGTLGAARLPTPGAATLGGVQSINCSAGGQFVQAINTNGTETCATPSGGGGGGVTDPGANGMMVRTALNTTAAVTIGASAGITVTNGSGVSGNPLIGLDTTVAVTQAQVQTLAPLVFNGVLNAYAGCGTNCYYGAMNPPPGNFVDLNNNPLTMDFCPNVTWTGGAVTVNQGLAAKRLLINGYDPPPNALVGGSCYLIMYNPAMAVDGVASVGAFELKSPSGVSDRLFLPNAGTTGTTLYKLTKLTGAPSTAVSAATSDTGGIVGITVAGAGTTLTAVIQVAGNASCVFDGATTAGHYVQISASVAGDCHDSGASYPTSGQVIGRLLTTNGSAGTDTIQLFGPEVQAAASAPNAGAAAHSVALNQGTGAAMTGAAIGTAGRLLIDQGAGADPSFNVVTGDATITNAGALTIAANAVTSAKMAAVNARRTCSVVIGADNGSALANADIGPQGRQCFVPAAATVVEITIAGDGGVPSVLVRKNHGGTTTNLTSAAFVTAASGGLACANAAGSGLGIDGATTCATALTATALAAGDWLELASGTADGIAKRMSITVTYSVN